jgi:hypothetical protein
LFTHIEKGPTWSWTSERSDTLSTPVYSGDGMNTIYELTEKIHELLERAG